MENYNTTKQTTKLIFQLLIYNTLILNVDSGVPNDNDPNRMTHQRAVLIVQLEAFWARNL